MHIESYEFGKMVIDGKEYTKDLIIYGDTVIDNWRREEGHILICDDLQPLWDLLGNKHFAFDALVLGMGSDGMMKLSPDWKDWVKFDLWVHQSDRLPTLEAVSLYNKRLADGEKVAGAFHLTC
jgi:hypothetical protein